MMNQKKINEQMKYIEREIHSSLIVSQVHTRWNAVYWNMQVQENLIKLKEKKLTDRQVVSPLINGIMKLKKNFFFFQYKSIFKKFAIVILCVSTIAIGLFLEMLLKINVQFLWRFFLFLETGSIKGRWLCLTRILFAVVSI